MKTLVPDARALRTIVGANRQEIAKVGVVNRQGWAAALAHPFARHLVNSTQCPFPDVIDPAEPSKSATVRSDGTKR